MGFFASEELATSTESIKDMLHRMECRACPLNNLPENKHQHMEPTGSRKPMVYFLGEAPGKDEDKAGRQFVGQSGQLLRRYIPEDGAGWIRWNNVVRTRPPESAVPKFTEIECCRPSVVADIVRTKPKAIAGFGGVPLQWALGVSGITDWRGRRAPVNIGGHSCWYYAFMHPAYLLKLRNDYRISDEEVAFKFDIQRMFSELPNLPEPVVHTPEMARDNVHVFDGSKAGDFERFKVAFDTLLEANVIGIDFETSALRPYRGGRLITAAFSSKNITVALALEHVGAQWTDAEYKALKRLLRSKLFDNPDKVKTVHNLSFELEWLAEFYEDESIVRALNWHCTMVQASVLDERVGNNALSLDFLTRMYFGISIKALTPLNRKKLEDEALDRVLVYNGIDAKYHRLLFRPQMRRIESAGLRSVYEMTLDRIAPLVLTQRKGVLIDTKANVELGKVVKARIEQASRAITESPEAAAFVKHTGRVMNPASLKDLQTLFGYVTRSSNYTYGEALDEEALAKIEGEFAKNLLTLRKASKLYSTYIEPYSATSPLVYPDSRVHPSFNPVFTTTGRLSANDPNVQNIPKRTESAKEIRKQLVAAPGHTLVAIDYGQIEARVCAMASKDKKFTKALWERFDIHGEWAKIIAHEYPKRVGGKQFVNDPAALKKFRTDVKNQWTFPLIFGASTRSVSKYLHIPESVLVPLVRRFWRQFPGLKDWQENQVKLYERKGYVSTLTGRRRHAPLTRNRIFNSPIQGTAADIVMDAMVKLFHTKDPRLHPILQIHDDLTFEIPTKDLETCVANIINLMLFPEYEFINCPITLEISTGPNLADMREIAAVSSDQWDQGAKRVRK